MSETARHADVIFPAALMEEETGTTTSVEGRVVLHKQAVAPPEGIRGDWRVVCDIAKELGQGDKFAFANTREIFEELRIASRGGTADYSGITWEKIEANKGIFWPCPDIDHPGTPRLYEGYRFGHPDGKARFQAIEWRPATEEPDEEYPVILTTGRVVAHYLSGTQTRRIGALVDQTPEPYCEMHPRLAAQLRVAEGNFVCVESRRGSTTVRAKVVKTIRPDTVFIPYHWPLARSVNNCTVRALDPVSNIPEFKICAVRITKVNAPDDAMAHLPPEAGGVREVNQ